MRGSTATHRNVFFGDETLPALAALPIRAAHEFFTGVELDGARAEIASRILREVAQRLQFLVDVGLDYLSLDRAAETLSGGEAQRIRLASQIGAGLVGVTYILDEPSIGLHQRDNRRLLDTLEHLRDIGNTVIVIEHDEEAINSADHVIDMGPGAGVARRRHRRRGHTPRNRRESGIPDRPVPLAPAPRSRCRTSAPGSTPCN